MSDYPTPTDPTDPAGSDDQARGGAEQQPTPEGGGKPPLPYGLVPPAGAWWLSPDHELSESLAESLVAGAELARALLAADAERYAEIVDTFGLDRRGELCALSDYLVAVIPGLAGVELRILRAERAAYGPHDVVMAEPVTVAERADEVAMWWLLRWEQAGASTWPAHGRYDGTAAAASRWLRELTPTDGSVDPILVAVQAAARELLLDDDLSG